MLGKTETTLRKLATQHHLHVFRSQRRGGEVTICPHCNHEMTDKDIYTDKKGWKFHRSCFTKGKGSIHVPERSKEATISGLAGLMAMSGLTVKKSGSMSLDDVKQALSENCPVIIRTPEDECLVLTKIAESTLDAVSPYSDEVATDVPLDQFLPWWQSGGSHAIVLEHVKNAYSGALGSGDGYGSSTQPPRLLAANGSTPAGAENQPASDAKEDSAPDSDVTEFLQEYLDHCEQPPDKTAFDLNLIKAAAVDAFATMSDGTEHTQEAADDQSVQWSTQRRYHGFPDSAMKHKLRTIAAANMPGYQETGTGVGRYHDPVGGPGLATAATAPMSAPPVGRPEKRVDEHEEANMQLDSTTAERGQPPHLSA